jgi:tetratricopeptide (TPR) repeat protein
MDSDRLAEAEEQFLAAIQVQPDLDSWRSLGEIYSRENAVDKSEDAWLHVVSFERFDPQAHLSLGQIYLSKGRYADAHREFDDCLLMDPKDKQALAGIGKLHELEQSHANSAGASR